MIQIKQFKIDDVKGFNDFIKKVRLAGEQPIKYNENSLFIFYEEGEKFDKNNKLKALHRNLEEAQINLLRYTQEHLYQQEMVKEYMARPKEEANEYDKRKFKEENETATKAKGKMVELEKLHIKVIQGMIKDVEKEK